MTETQVKGGNNWSIIPVPVNIITWRYWICNTKQHLNLNYAFISAWAIVAIIKKKQKKPILIMTLKSPNHTFPISQELVDTQEPRLLMPLILGSYNEVQWAWTQETIWETTETELQVYHVDPLQINNWTPRRPTSVPLLLGGVEQPSTLNEVVNMLHWQYAEDQTSVSEPLSPSPHTRWDPCTQPSRASPTCEDTQCDACCMDTSHGCTRSRTHTLIS